jgi:hypothetical protein
VKFARNGTSLHTDWNPDRRGALYDALLTRVRSAIRSLHDISGNVKIAGFFWMQGEWDADTLTNAKAYRANLARLIARLRADLRVPSLPVVAGRIRDVRTVSLWRPFSDVVRQAQMSVAVTDPRTYLVSTDGLPIDPRSPVHFDTRGIVGLGELLVQRRFGL